MPQPRHVHQCNHGGGHDADSGHEAIEKGGGGVAHATLLTQLSTALLRLVRPTPRARVIGREAPGGRGECRQPSRPSRRTSGSDEGGWSRGRGRTSGGVPREARWQTQGHEAGLVAARTVCRRIVAGLSPADGGGVAAVERSSRSAGAETGTRGMKTRAGRLRKCRWKSRTSRGTPSRELAGSRRI